MILQRFLRTRILSLLPSSLGGDRRFAHLSFVESYLFPAMVQARFAAEHPDFDAEERAQVFEGLRDYFAICAADPQRRAGMPSRIVDEAWHTFILFTREYTDFCQRAFGGYLHHAPSGSAGNDEEIRHTWRLACARANIPVTNPVRLPRLFGIDRSLAIPGARYYALNETDADRARQMMGANATITLAMAFGILESWNDPIFTEMHAMTSHQHLAGGVAGDAAGFDISGGDGGGGSGGGGCSGGGN